MQSHFDHQMDSVLSDPLWLSQAQAIIKLRSKHKATNDNCEGELIG
jgi:hypothetical protein